MNRLAITILSLVLALPTASAQATQTFFVDPVAGTDATGGGTSARNALHTIAFALREHQRLGGGNLILELLPGRFAVNTNGELFPIVLPANVVVGAVVPGTVEIHHQVGALVAADFLLHCDLVGIGDRCEFRDLSLSGDQSGIRIRSQRGSSHTALVERVSTNMLGAPNRGGGIGVRVIASSELTYVESERRSLDRTVDTWMTANGTGTLTALVDRCFSRNERASNNSATAMAYRLTTVDRALMDVTFRNSAITKRVRAIQIEGRSSRTLTVTAEHCAFHGCGLQAWVGGLGQRVVGGAVEEIASNGVAVTLDHCAFFANLADAPQYDPRRYTLRHNLVEEPALLAAPGGQVTGDPRWPDPASGDFHQGAGSACRDAGGTSPLTADVDGDDRSRPCAGPADPGPDESADRHLHLVSTFRSRLRLGTAQNALLLGDGGSLALLAVGLPRNAPGCDDLGLDPTGPIFGVSAPASLPGLPGIQTSLQIGFAIPNDPALAGASLTFAALYLETPGTTPTLHHSADARTVLLLP